MLIPSTDCNANIPGIKLIKKGEMLIPSSCNSSLRAFTSLSRRVNANSQRCSGNNWEQLKLIKKGEC